jgi:dolichol-phosphate mannosyltransferase
MDGSRERIVVIPTYNEIENIETVLRRVMALSPPFDVLIVDDGSPDGTAAKVRELAREFGETRIQLLERSGKLGLGTAYLTGFKRCLANGYAYIFEMDADLSHNPDDLVRLWQACVDGADMAVGSRYIQGVNVVNWPIGRVLMSYFAGVYVRFITGMPIMDATAGFKCYTRKVLETIDLDGVRFVGYAFQIEMKFTAWKFGFKIKEVPIIFTDRTKGVSKMSTRIFKEAFLGVIQLKVNSFFRRYIREAA